MEGKKAGRAAHIAVMAEDFAAVAGGIFVEMELRAEGAKNIATACVPNPA